MMLDMQMAALEHVKPARSGYPSSGWIARVDFGQLGAGTR